MIEAYTGLEPSGKKSRLPARLDVLLSLTGFLLALFMIGHMLFVATILISENAMAWITHLFEIHFIVPGGSGIVVRIVGIIVFIMFFVHAFLALRRYPSKRSKYQKFVTHKKMMNHKDTTLWYLQAATGIFLMFSVIYHLYTMIDQPLNIGPNLSSYRVYSQGLWIFYIALLFFVELHVSIGLYRLAVKWGIVNTKGTRKALVRFKTIFSICFIVLGLFTLAAYYKIGKYNEMNGIHTKYVYMQK